MGVIGVTSDGQFPLMATMDDVFSSAWGRDMTEYESHKGGAGAIGIDTSGAFNAVYGPYLQNLAYNAHNTYAVIGQKPYKTGRRFQESLSLDAAATTGIVRGGYAPAPNYGNYVQVEMPYKVSAKRQAMNLGYDQIGEKAIDDVMTWEDFFREEGQTWLWSINNDLLRRVADPRIAGKGSVPVGSSDPASTEFVGFESIDRIISNFEEGKFVNGGSAAGVNNVPWAMATQLPSTDSPAALAKYRNPAVTGAVADNNFNCYVDANYTASQTDGTAELRQLTLAMIDSMFMGVMPYWDNKTQNKVMITRYDTLQKIQTLLQPQQRYIGQVGAAVNVNGISTVPGRETGFLVSAYNGVPIVPDLMVPGGYGTTAAGHAKDGSGNIYLVDTDTLFNGVLQAPVVNISQNPIITGRYTRLCDMFCLGETTVNGKFKGLGKIVHLS